MLHVLLGEGAEVGSQAFAEHGEGVGRHVGKCSSLCSGLYSLCSISPLGGRGNDFNADCSAFSLEMLWACLLLQESGM